MCNTQTLAYAAEGYIIRCSGCGRMQLAFGTVALAIDRGQLLRLRRMAAVELDACPQDDRTGYKCCSLPVDDRTVLCLTRRELEVLSDLCDQAAALVEVYEMLS